MFTWGDDLEAYRARLVAVLDDLVDADATWTRASVGYTADDSRRVCRSLAAHGFLVPHWPVAWGGQGLTPWHQLVVAEEMWRRGEPRAPQYLNINFIGPAIGASGTDLQREQHLPAMAAGEALWCQGFSEADAGSDLSRIRTRASAVDGGYVVQGAKQWISYADVADHCFLLAVLDRGEAPSERRRRIVLLVAMTSPGIGVREIPAIPGPHTFHEVRFDDVFVPASGLLGTEDTGWQVVTAALADERIGAPEYVRAEAALDRLASASMELRPTTQAAIGAAYTRCHATRLLTYAAVHERATGAPATTLPFRARAAGRVARQAVADAVAAVLADGGGSDTADADVEAIDAILAGVAGGAYEVLLDLVASELTGIGRS